MIQTYHRSVVEEVFNALIEIFQDNKHADKVIQKHLKENKKWGARDRRFFAETVYEMVRWWRLLWFLLRSLLESEEAQKIFPSVEFHELLKNTENYFNNSAQAGLPSDSSPKLSKKLLYKLWAVYLLYKKGMTILPEWFEVSLDFSKWKSHRDYDPIELTSLTNQLKEETKKASRGIKESFPEWLDQKGEEELGLKTWLSSMSYLNEKPPVDLRVNLHKTSRSELKKLLADEGTFTDLIPQSEQGLTLVERKNVFISPLFQKGFFEVQDRSSQGVGLLLDPQPGERIVDACAGAGGKSLHLSNLMKNKGKILALDIHQWKLDELRVRARRNGSDIIETRLIDSTKVIKRLEGKADRLLLDVPCSGLGVLRRNPDTKWKLGPKNLEELIQLQRDLLKNYSSMVKKGGRMVYATCSLMPSENEKQIEWFLSTRDQEWKLVEMKRSRIEKGQGDLFFAALLEKI